MDRETARPRRREDEFLLLPQPGNEDGLQEGYRTGKQSKLVPPFLRTVFRAELALLAERAKRNNEPSARRT